MVRKILIVLNPAAGDGAADEVRDALARTHDGADWDLTYYETSEDESVADHVADALSEDEYDAVYAVGGDGTVSATADALVHGDTPLGIIPVGTANALARELGVPEEIEDACRFLADDPPTRQLDAIEIDGKGWYGFQQVSVGLVADVMENTSRAEKENLGPAAYVKNALGRLRHGDSRRFELTLDGKERQVRASEIALANTATMGVLQAKWGPQIDPDSGHVDVCVIRGRAPLDFAIIVADMILRRHRPDPRLQYFTASESAKVATDRETSVQVDGEPAGQAPVQVRIHPHSLPVLAPPKDESVDNPLKEFIS